MQVDERNKIQGGFEMNKTWFITGASRGFGRVWAEAALKRGDKVAATARKLEDVAGLKERFGDAVLPLALDVTNSEQATAEAVLKLVDTNDPPLRLDWATRFDPGHGKLMWRVWRHGWEDVSNAAMGELKKTMTEWIEQLAQATPVRA
jgi:NAD(P)-dependent dehydrogenase (short-subunit alcohol dehydrogenase family)